MLILKCLKNRLRRVNSGHRHPGCFNLCCIAVGICLLVVLWAAGWSCPLTYAGGVAGVQAFEMTAEGTEGRFLIQESRKTDEWEIGITWERETVDLPDISLMGIVFSIKLPVGCRLSQLSAVEGVTVTVGENDGFVSSKNECEWRILCDGMMTIQSDELGIHLSLIHFAVEGGEGGSELSVSVLESVLYRRTTEGEIMAYPIQGDMLVSLPIPPVSDENTPVETEVVSDIPAENPTHPCKTPNTRLLGCQESNARDGSFAVRFLFYIEYSTDFQKPCGETGVPITVTGGGLLTLEIRPATATEWTAVLGNRAAQFDHRGVLLLCTYRGLDPTAIYRFSLCQNRKIIQINYKNGKFEGFFEQNIHSKVS